MDNKAIVLIIGAGGSVPFGFPTGEDLKREICDSLVGVESAGSSQKQLAQALLKEGFDIEELAKLRDRLRMSGWSSVDEFLQNTVTCKRLEKRPLQLY